MKCVKIPITRSVRISEAAENIPPEWKRILRKSNIRIETQIHALEDKIKPFIREAIEASDQGETLELIVLGDWGTGKTWLADEIKELVEKEGMLYEYESMENIISYLHDSRVKEHYNPEKILENAFFRKIKDKLETDQEKILFYFIDELEALVRDSSLMIGHYPLIDLFANFLKKLRSRNTGLGQKYGGRLHLIMAMTPSAYQLFIARLKSTETYGTYSRRFNVVQLYSALKTEIIYAIETILKSAYGVKPEDLFQSRQIEEIFYTVSEGNLGIALKLLHYVIYYSMQSCREAFNENCLCKIDESNIFAAFRGSPITTPSGSEEVLNSTILHEILKGESPLHALVTRAILTSSLIYEEDYPNLQKFVSDAEKLLDVKFVEGIAYVFENEPKLAKILNEVADEIATTLTESNRYLLLQSLFSMIHFYHSKPVFFLPLTREIFEQYLSTKEIVELTDEIVSSIKTVLRKECKETIRAVGLAPEEYPRLYPSVSTVGIPFLPNKYQAKTVFVEIKEKLKNNPEDLEILINSSVINLLQHIGLASSHGRKLQLSLNYDGTKINIQVETAVFLQYIKERIREGALKCLMTNNPTICIFVYPYEKHTILLENVPEDWNIIKFPIKLHHLYFLAAYPLANRRKFKVDRRSYSRFLSDLSSIYHIVDLVKERIREGLRKGIIIPNRLKGMEEFVGIEKKPLIYFLEGYKSLLIGAGDFSLESLLQLIGKLYKIKPYSRKSKFKGKIPIPSLMSLDLEPERTEGELDLSLFEKRAKDILSKIINVAKKNHMIKVAKEEEGVFRLTLHPIEERVLKILRKTSDRELEENNLKKYFVFSEPERESEELLTRLIDLLEKRGLIRVSTAGRIRKIKLLESEEDLHNIIKQKLKQLSRCNDTLLEYLEKLGIKKTLSNPLLHIAVLKVKGWKLIKYHDVIDVIKEYSELIKRRKLEYIYTPYNDEEIKYTENYKSGMILFEELLDYGIALCKYFIDEGPLKVLEGKISDLLDAEEKGKDIYNEVTKLSSKFLDKEISKILTSTVNEEILLPAETYKNKFLNILKNISWDDVLKIGKELLGKCINNRRGCSDHDAEDFLFSLPGNNYFNNLILYALMNLSKKYPGEIKPIDLIINNVRKMKQEVLYVLRDILHFLERLQREGLNREAYERSLVEKIRNAKTLMELSSVLQNYLFYLKKDLEDLEEKKSYVKEVIEKFRKCSELIDKFELKIKELNELKHKADEIVEIFVKLNLYSEDDFSKLDELTIEYKKLRKFIDKTKGELKELPNEYSELMKIHLDNPAKFTGIVSKLSDIEANATRYIENVSKLVNEINSTLNESFSKMLKELKEKLDSVITLSKKLKISDPEIYRLKSKAKELKVDFEDFMLSWKSYNYTSIEKMLKEYIALLNEIKTIRKELLKNAGIGGELLQVYDILEEFSNREISFPDLVNEISRNTNLSEKDIAVALYELSKKKLVRLKALIIT